MGLSALGTATFKAHRPNRKRSPLRRRVFKSMLLRMLSRNAGNCQA